MKPIIEQLLDKESDVRRESLKFLKEGASTPEIVDLLNSTIQFIYRYILPTTIYDTEDQETIRLIGIRLFNSANTAFDKAIGGYYQVSVSIHRDIMEMQFLLDYFKIDPSQIEVWRKCTNSERKKKFSPGALRDALDKRDGYKEQKRRKQYEEHCEYAAHVTYPGMELLKSSDGNTLYIGPFFDKLKLYYTLQNLAKYLGHAALTLSSHLPMKDPNSAVDMVEFGNKFDALFNTGFNTNPRYIKFKKLVDLLKSGATTVPDDFKLD